MEIASLDAAARARRNADVLDRLDALLTLTDQLPGALAMLADVADEAAGQAQQHGLDLDALLREGGALLGALGQATVDAGADLRATPAPRLGLFGLLQALRDPDVQHTLGFVLTLSRHLGRRLRAGQPAP